MTPSDSTYRKVILHILEQIDPARLQHRIDNPARRTVESFQPSSRGRQSVWDFMEFVKDVMIRLHAIKTLQQIPLSHEGAYDKAIEYLDRSFPSNDAPGSDTALNDFIHCKSGVRDQIKSAILAGFVSEIRQRFIQGVLTEQIGRDWDHRYYLTRTFLKMFHQELPPTLATEKPEDFADCLEKLLLAYARTRHSVMQLIASS
jgi:hypothetical protein